MASTSDHHVQQLQASNSIEQQISTQSEAIMNKIAVLAQP